MGGVYPPGDRSLNPGACHRTLTIVIVVALCAVGAHGQTDTIPQRTDENLIVAAYDIQWLGEKPPKLAEVMRSVLAEGETTDSLETSRPQLSPPVLEMIRTASRQDANDRGGFG